VNVLLAWCKNHCSYAISEAVEVEAKATGMVGFICPLDRDPIVSYTRHVIPDKQYVLEDVCRCGHTWGHHTRVAVRAGFFNCAVEGCDCGNYWRPGT